MSKVEATCRHARFPIPQGTLDMLILQTRVAGARAWLRHRATAAAGIARGRAGQSGLALSRLCTGSNRKAGSKSAWRQSETGREAKFYALTPAGQKQLAVEKDDVEPPRGGRPVDLQRRGIAPWPNLLNLLPWRRRRMEQDLDRELRYHVDRRVERPEAIRRERARSTPAGGARVRRHRRRCRRKCATRGCGAGSTRWRRDVRYAGRTLRRSPGFTAAAVALAGAGHRRQRRDLLARRSGPAAHAAGAGAGASGSPGLERSIPLRLRGAPAI